MYAENTFLQVFGLSHVLPRCGIWARLNHAKVKFANELGFAVVPLPYAPTNLLMLLPKAPTNFRAQIKT